MISRFRRAKELRLGIRAQLLVSQALGQIMPIAAIPFLTRLLNPEQMGHYQVALSIALVALPFALFQADVFVPVARDADEVRLLERRAVLTTLIVGSIATSVAALLPNGGGLEAAVTTALLLAIMSLISVTNAVLIRKNDMPKLVHRNIAGGAFVAISQTIFAMLHPTSISLGLGMFVGRAFCQALLRSGKACAPHPNIADVPKDLWRVLSGASANALGTFASQMPMLLVAPVYGAAAAGYLGLGQRVVGAPTALIGQGVNQIIVADASAIIRGGEAKLWPGLRRQIIMLISLSLAAALAIAVIIPPLTSWIFGAPWAPAGDYMRILALPMCLQLVAIPMAPLMVMLGMQQAMLAIQIGRIFCTVGCILAAAHFALGMPLTVTLISAVWSLAYVVTIGLTITGMRKYDRLERAS
ncbi:oligosaccharide flippase family protein [Sphingomonas sp. HF-S3]|uniref:Oligosaccharide flippase family protein n=1 Tax=Sphingomonas rustica TaxID=3103142 RepID=A0ABV0B930_9SPHN